MQSTSLWQCSAFLIVIVLFGFSQPGLAHSASNPALPASMCRLKCQTLPTSPPDAFSSASSISLSVTGLASATRSALNQQQHPTVFKQAVWGEPSSHLRSPSSRWATPFDNRRRAGYCNLSGLLCYLLCLRTPASRPLMGS